MNHGHKSMCGVYEMYCEFEMLDTISEILIDQHRENVYGEK